MDSVLEDKQNRDLMITRKGIYVSYIIQLWTFQLVYMM